ncbi:MAG: ester cyclase [Chloroflexota bacterium]|nr:ester cyclase [Chloroflexota bacterium]
MRRTVCPVLVLVAMLLGAFTVVYLPATAAQEATPAGTACPTTSVEENEALVSQLYDAINANDEPAMAAVMAADLTHYTPARGERPGSPDEFFQGQREHFPDATVTVDLLVAERDMVAAYTSWTGIFQGPTAMFFGDEIEIPATGLSSEWVSVVFFRIECGQVSEVWPLADRLSQLRHLGIITEEELRSVDPVASPAP